MRFYIILIFCLSTLTGILSAQDHSIARDWNEELLFSIRNDFARPTVHARNLWHTSMLMYDLWALINDETADTYLVGKSIRGFDCPSIDLPNYSLPKDEVLRIAISHGMYTLINQRFRFSPGYFSIRNNIRNKMVEEGLNSNYTSEDYTNGNPAALGNYLANRIIEFGAEDFSNEANQYANVAYQPVNDPLVMTASGDNNMEDPNRWQPLTLDEFIDQSGNPIPFNTPDFLSPEWGRVTPFALSDSDLTVYNRDNFDYYVYHDPGPPPLVNLDEKTEDSEDFLWGFSLVSIWGSHLDPTDGVMWDISPGSIGNIPSFPNSFSEYTDFYNTIDGGDPSLGHALNPKTGQPYETNMVPRADYARVLAEFWADGPDSETPPGHWFTLLNYVNDHPEFKRSYRGVTDELDPLEWDVKAYFLMGAAMHDVAITAWGIKGWYDYLRPVSAIRSMVTRGQSTIETLPNYDPAGIPLRDGYVEIITLGDDLAGNMGENIGKIKIYSWRGPDFIEDPETDVAGVGWILAENWWPYQRPSFVTPPFAGYLSGHSTFSRAAAEVLTAITGDPFFPGGMAEFKAEANEFLVFESGPSVDVTLQWATYRDASDQTSLSRIWGGIHPPADDIPGRLIGAEIAEDVLTLGESIFFVDSDNDGFYNYEDCDDNDDQINPDMAETCDGLDNNCSGAIDEGLQLFRYYIDEDGDGFGNALFPIDTCRSMSVEGYVTNDLDCNDNNSNVNPDASETCDGIDNNCSGLIDEDLPLFTYYLDFDQDGFGDKNFPVDTCRSNPINGYVINDQDCNDNDNSINPNALELCDAIDNDCNGRADDGLPTNRYFIDTDGDQYGNVDVFIDSCVDLSSFIYLSTDTYVRNSLDCDDSNALYNPDALDVADNYIDEDCNGLDSYKLSKIFPNPFSNEIEIHYDSTNPVRMLLYDSAGHVVHDRRLDFIENSTNLDLSYLSGGVYFFRLLDDNDNELYAESILKI